MSGSGRKETKNPEEKISRSKFFLKLGIGAISVTTAGSGLFVLDFLSPRAVLEKSPVFNAGSLENFAPDSVTLDAENRTFIIREKKGGIYAISALCTHLGCLTRWNDDKMVIACPCHGTTFSKTGCVIEGPALKSLPRFAVRLNDKNEILVDRSVVVDEEQIFEV